MRLDRVEAVGQRRRAREAGALDTEAGLGRDPAGILEGVGDEAVSAGGEGLNGGHRRKPPCDWGCSARFTLFATSCESRMRRHRERGRAADVRRDAAAARPVAARRRLRHRDRRGRGGRRGADRALRRRGPRAADPRSAAGGARRGLAFRCCVLAEGTIDDQARRLAAALGIDWLRAPFTRCVIDNAVLEAAPPEAAARGAAALARGRRARCCAVRSAAGSTGPADTCGACGSASLPGPVDGRASGLCSGSGEGKLAAQRGGCR